MSVIETQFSTSSCSNMPEVPKHIRYARYESRLKLSGADASTANQDRISVSRSETGCHWRSEMNGTTVPASKRRAASATRSTNSGSSGCSARLNVYLVPSPG